MMRQHTRLIAWLMALLAMAGFTALGLWQLQRMHAKQAMLDAQGPAVAQALPLSQALAAPGALQRTPAGPCRYPSGKQSLFAQRALAAQ